MNWYQNDVNEEIKRVGSRDKVKHNEMSYQSFLREYDDSGRAKVTMDEERVLRVCWAKMRLWRLGSCENFVGKFKNKCMRKTEMWLTKYADV